MRDFDLTGETLHRLRVSDLDPLVEAGVFDDRPHVELLDGVLVAMSEQSDAHMNLTSWLGTQLARRLDDSYRVFQHSNLQVGDYSLPEPDLYVVTRDQLRVTRRLRRAILVVEIAWSSHIRDRRKAALYAAKGIPEYWLVDIPHESVEIRTDPSRRRYRSVEVVGRDATLCPHALPGLSISVDQMFGDNVLEHRRQR